MPWFEGCAICKLDGDLDSCVLVACDSCNKDFHVACLPVEDQPGDGDWYCPDCVGDAPKPPPKLAKAAVASEEAGERKSKKKKGAKQVEEEKVKEEKKKKKEEDENDGGEGQEEGENYGEVGFQTLTRAQIRKLCAGDEPTTSSSAAGGGDSSKPLTPAVIKGRPLKDFLRAVVRSLGHMPRFQPFFFPLDPRLFPDYYEKVEEPTNLRTIDRKVSEYRCR